MSRTATIASIIEKRRPLAQKIEGVEANLRNLDSALRHLENHRHQLIMQVDDASIAGKLREIDFSTHLTKIADELAVLERLRGRFCRDTLNIGVVGRMKQGKSTLLQNLSGLDNTIIPSHSGSNACTAVKSTIRHREQSETDAKITFHSEESLFRQVIVPYYQELQLNPVPISLNDFFHSPFNHPLPDNATKEAMYEHLKSQYYSHQNAYRNSLSQGQKIVSANEIKDYVIHTTDVNNPNAFKNLAVREVEIYCTFPNSEVGQIALVDIPGLGDLKLGDEQLMLQTLGTDVDIVLFVRFPNPITGDSWKIEDTRLYDKAAQALTDLPLRSFMVINQSSNHPESDTLCRDFQQKIRSGERGIRVVDCIIADCSNYENANQVLDRVLNHLETRITELDTKYAKSSQDRLLEIQQRLNTELQKAINTFGRTTENSGTAALFVPLFSQLWNSLTNGLEELLKQLRKNRDEVNIDFKDQVDAAIQACHNDTGIPTIEQIEERNNSVGGYNIAYGIYLNEIRAHLSQHFLSLDEGLKRSLDRVKCQVAEVLIEKGRLGGLTEIRGVEFIRAIAEEIPEQLIPGNVSKIKFGFKLLAEFEISYRGFIQHRIRQNLDILTPNEETALKLSQTPNAQQVLSSLKTAYAEAVYKCENALEDLLCEPSQAAFAIIEEFLDRILRAEDVESEWRIFLDDVRSDIWSEFRALGDRTKIRKEWLNSVEKVATANQSGFLEFLN